MQNTKVPSQHTSWSAMTRSSWKCGLTVCTRFSIDQPYKMVYRHVFHVILLSWHGKLFSCCSRWRGSHFHSQVQASGVEVRIPDRLLKARETWNLSRVEVWLLSNNPHIAVNIFFLKYNVLKKHVNLLPLYSPKLAVIQYAVMINFLKYLNVNVTWKVIPELWTPFQVRPPLISRSRSVQGTLHLFLWTEQVQPLNIWGTPLTPTLLSIWRRWWTRWGTTRWMMPLIKYRLTSKTKAKGL